MGPGSVINAIPGVYTIVHVDIGYICPMLTLKVIAQTAGNAMKMSTTVHL